MTPMLQWTAPPSWTYGQHEVTGLQCVIRIKAIKRMCCKGWVGSGKGEMKGEYHLSFYEIFKNKEK